MSEESRCRLYHNKKSLRAKDGFIRFFHNDEVDGTEPMGIAGSKRTEQNYFLRVVVINENVRDTG
jgi:hypothetical protein